MATAIEKLRAALQEKTEKKNRTSNSGDNASYPFWDMKEGQTATVRFLPDLDPENTLFWVAKQTIKLEFAGQVGGDYPTDKTVTVTVPCVEMFEKNTCPITAEIRPWWTQGDDKKALAKKYYRKVNYLYQGFVVSSPFEEQNVPENPIRRFVINSSIHELIEKSLMNPEMEDMPTDFNNGRDFKIAKTLQGGYSNYTTSSWSFRTRPLSDIETAALSQFGLHNLKDFIGARPDANGIAIIKAMFHDSLEGKPFDFAAYGHVYRAYGGNRSEESNTSSAISQNVQRSVRVTEDTSDETPVVEKTTVSATTAPKASTADILARIRQKTLTDKQG